MQFKKGRSGQISFAALNLSTGLLSAFLLSAVPALAANVIVHGNSRVDSETISGFFAGSDEAAINKAVKDLYATGFFSDVKVSHAGGSIVVTVKENTTVNRVAFEGNSKVKTEQLQGEIKSKSRGPYSPTIVDADIERIKDIYRRAGHAAASVTARTVNLPNGKFDVVFTINEGDKTGVKQINFVGNHVYSAGTLRDLMTTTEMNFLSFFKTSDVYDPDRIGKDLELIRRFYLKNGYADFRVVGSDAQFDPAQGGYIITITVEEGPQYTISSVNVESHLPNLDGASLQGSVRLRAGETYNGDLVEKTVDALTREIGKHGFPFSQVHPRGDRDPNTRTVSIVFVIDEGPRVYVEKIVIRGNTRTRDYVIRREFDLAEGDAYNKALVDRAERRLNNLGFFAKVKITNEPGSAPDRVNIVVEVEDKPTGSLSLSGGYSTSAGFIAEVAVTETNFMGRGQYVRLAVSEGQYSRGVEFNFTEPYFLGNRLAAGFDLFAKETSVSQYSFYDNFITGTTLRFGLPVTEELTFSPRYSIYHSQISVPDDSSHPYNGCHYPVYGTTPSPADGSANYGTGSAYWDYSCLTQGQASLAVLEEVGGYWTSMAGYSLTYNGLDNNKNPTQGFFAELKQDVAGLGGDAHYVRTTGDIRFYYPVWDQIVGFVRAQGGDLIPTGGQNLRIVDNFNLGPSLVRGFAPNGIGPRDVSAGVNYDGNPLGGTKYYGGTVELQFPIWGLPRDIGLKGALFSDAGALWGYTGRTNFTYLNGGVVVPNNVYPLYTQGNIVTVGGDPISPRVSIGASLIWQSPLGPIRFDFAKAVVKNQYDQTQFFRFTGGTTF